MSNWTMEEVNRLTDGRSGGNAAALHTWLQNAPAYGGKYPGGARPKQGDRVEVFKQFVLDCYEHGKFRANTPYVPQAAGSGSTLTASAPASTKSSSRSSPVPTTTAPPAVTSKVSSSNFAAEFDFFNDSGAVTPPGPAANSSKAPSLAPSAGVSPVPFAADFASFGAFDAPPPVAPAASVRPPVANKTSSAALIDLLDDFGSTPSVPPAAPALSSAPSFDPFYSATATAPVSTAATKSTASGFSFMDEPLVSAPAPTSSHITPTPSSNNVLDLFNGLSFDAPPSAATSQPPMIPNNGLNRSAAPVMTAPVMMRPNPMGGGPMGYNASPYMSMNNSSTPSPTPMMMNSHTPPMMGNGMNSGIGGMRSVSAPSGTTGFGNGMMRPPQNNAGAISTMGMGGGPAMGSMYGAPMGGPGRGAPGPNMSGGASQGSFDFLQETMRKHLDTAGPPRGAAQGGKPINPFL